jgi:hypothetical protein
MGNDKRDNKGSDKGDEKGKDIGAWTSEKQKRTLGITSELGMGDYVGTNDVTKEVKWGMTKERDMGNFKGRDMDKN